MQSLTVGSCNHKPQQILEGPLRPQNAWCAAKSGFQPPNCCVQLQAPQLQSFFASCDQLQTPHSIQLEQQVLNGSLGPQNAWCAAKSASQPYCCTRLQAPTYSQLEQQRVVIDMECLLPAMHIAEGHASCLFLQSWEL